METLQDFFHEIQGNPEALNFILDLRGNFRQIFDCWSAEWRDSDLPHKLQIIEKFESFGITRQRLKNAFKASYPDRPDVVNAADLSLRAVELQSLWAALKEIDPPTKH